VKASHFASGDQRGDASLGPLVKGRGDPDPSVEAIQIAVS
jgi:hypothetical protein